jgi:hypothetical protein
VRRLELTVEGDESIEAGKVMFRPWPEARVGVDRSGGIITRVLRRRRERTRRSLGRSKRQSRQGSKRIEAEKRFNLTPDILEEKVM